MSHSENGGQTTRVTPKGISPEIQAQILNSLEGLQFGSVEIVVHDSRVVQIERKEKTRFDARNREPR